MIRNRRPPSDSYNMPQQFPSIQSFFQPEVSPAKRDKASSPPRAAGDGFTAEEVDVTFSPPSLPQWQPRGTYKDVDIETLIPGPGCVTIMGRVVNFFVLGTPSKAPHAAKGCLKMVVKDDTGALVVNVLAIRETSAFLLLTLGPSVV